MNEREYQTVLTVLLVRDATMPNPVQAMRGLKMLGEDSGVSRYCDAPTNLSRVGAAVCRLAWSIPASGAITRCPSS